MKSKRNLEIAGGAV